MTKKKVYKEHEKLQTVLDSSREIGTFLEWLMENSDFAVCEPSQICRGSYEYLRTSKRIQDILALYFDIDLKKLEEEKVEILTSFRKNQE